MDLFGGNFNSGDFYGMGADPAEDFAIKYGFHQAVYEPDGSAVQAAADDYQKLTGNTIAIDPKTGNPAIGPDGLWIIKESKPSGTIFDSFSALSKGFKSVAASMSASAPEISTKPQEDYFQSFIDTVVPTPTPVSPVGVVNTQSPVRVSPVAPTSGAIVRTVGLPASRGSVVPRSQTSSSFSQDLNAVFASITSVFTPLVAAKQQRTQAAAQRRGRVPAASSSIRSGGSDNTTTYLMIGGGALLLFGLIFVATKE